MNLAKAVVAGISIILIVGACIGLIAGLITGGFDDDYDKNTLSTSSKTVALICNQTDFKYRCVDSISSVALNTTATPLDFIKAAIDHTIWQVESSINRTVLVGKYAVNSTHNMAVEDCKVLLRFAIDELQASLSSLENSTLDTIKDYQLQAALKNWLSAVMSYQATCLDGFTSTPLYRPIAHTLSNSTHLTSNALALISSISDILTAFRIPSDDVSANATSRKLVESKHAYHANGFPRWTSTRDRKLLASQNNANVKPNAIVAKDGSGQYETITAALAAYPENLAGRRYVIYVKAGLYNECITIRKDQINVFIYGDGPRKTTVTGNKSKKDGITTFRTASFSAIGDGFMAKSMGFQNTAGAKGHQAVALRIQSDRSALYNCRIDGYQNTLYQQAHRQFYRNCVISGTVDFIFGDATAIIQNSFIIVRKPNPGQKNIITAHGRTDRHESTGLVIQNCRIVPEQKLFQVSSRFPSYLGRPRKQYSRTVIMESQIGGFIQPAGWLEWTGNLHLDTLYYAEYGNQGLGANTTDRVKWKGYHVLIDKSQVLQFTATRFLQGNQWLHTTGFPHFLGLTNA